MESLSTARRVCMVLCAQALGIRMSNGWWKGPIHDGVPCGRGVFMCDDGAKYDGELDQAGKRHGRGVATFAHGAKYDGEWQAGKQHGRGVHTNADGGKYDGEFQAGKQHGRGVFTDASGQQAGQWRRGEFVG